MALVKTIELLNTAKQGGYAIGAFNVDNIDMLLAVVDAVKQTKKSIIIQTTPASIEYQGASYFYDCLIRAIDGLDTDISLHLDHGNSYDITEKVAKIGYTGVMIDGSKLSLDDNILLTKKVVQMASLYNIPVEAELGAVGGTEDGERSIERLTKVEDAKRFVDKSGCHSLAIAIGTAHGIYKGEPILDIERLKQINKQVNIPLVLHGATGISDNQLVDCIKNGISKINFATELRLAFTKGIMDTVKGGCVFDPKIYLPIAKENVKNAVINKLKVING